MATMFQRRSDGRWCVRVPVGDERVFVSAATREEMLARARAVDPEVRVREPGELEGDEARFWKKVSRGSGCWMWTGHRNADGYGQFRIGARLQKAHRVAYEMAFGPIPEGLTIDHLCHVTSCVNPGHLEPVTMRVNLDRRRPRHS